MLVAKPLAMRALRLPAGVLAALVCLAPCAHAQSRDGLFLSVPNPITTEFVTQVQKAVDEAVKPPAQRKISIIVFDFNPTGHPSATSEYGNCFDLARKIQDLGRKYKTVAFISNEVTQHTVLPVLACNEIVMTYPDRETKVNKAKLGDITRGLQDFSDETRGFYRKLAKDKNLGDLVERMMNPNLSLRKVRTAGGTTLYVSDETFEKNRSKYTVPEDTTLPPGLEQGNALFDAETATQVRTLCQAQAESRADLAAKLGLPRKVLTENLLTGKTQVVWRIEFKGDTDKGSLDSLVRRINHARDNNANFIILQLEGTGGDTTNVASTAEFIRTLMDKNESYPIRTVAYLPPGTSLGAATFLALGCSEIVMAENAVLADFSYLQNEKEADLKTRRDMLIPLVVKQGYSTRLFEATLTPNLALFWGKSNTTQTEKLMTADDLLRDKKEWRQDRPVTGAGPLLKIDATLARDSHTAQILTNASFQGLCSLYGIDAAKVRLSGDGWLDRVAEFFREPLVRFLLVMLGIIGLILELKMPGTAVPGTLAAICFVLFFWSYSFVGEYTMLAVLLFILGVILLAVEIFVLPGFGFAGIAGILLIVVSLTLVTLEKWPTTSSEWYSLVGTIGTFGMSLVAAVVSAMIVAWFLPSIPYANKLVLNPPSEETEPALDTAAPVSLLGSIGIAATTLRPAGKAQFGEDFHDVIAEGDFVDPGQRVQVIEIEGNRIVVKAV